jgi:hypothetical protein
MAKKPQKTPMDEIIDNIVVFRIEGRENDANRGHVSNDPWWRDNRVRTAWLNRYAPEDTDGDGDVDDDDEVDELPSYETLSNDELRAELSTRGLSVDGKKADMIQRLEENDSKG